MERFADLNETVDNLGTYVSSGLSLEEQKEILSNSSNIKRWVVDNGWFNDISENMYYSVGKYSDDQELIDRVEYDEMEEGDEDLLVDEFCDFIVNNYSFWWAGADSINDIQEDTKVRLYRAVGVDDMDELSLEQEHLGQCWTYDKETAGEIYASLQGRIRLIFTADVLASGIDFVLSSIMQLWDEGDMIEREVRLIDTDAIDLLSVEDKDGNLIWTKEEGWK